MTDAPRPNLLVIGAGTLGTRVVRHWIGADQANQVLAETRSNQRHEALSAAGARVRLRSDPLDDRVDNVLFCVPPSAVSEYQREAERACDLWSRTGRLVMTSSTAVFEERDGGPCTESSAVVRSARTEPLLAAEEVVLGVGGVVVRLAGLYDQQRGPHRVFLRQTHSPKRPDGLLNLLHYDDAAFLCLRALLHGQAGTVYLGADGEPITRRALANGAFEHAGLFGADASNGHCVFEGTTGALGRRCDPGETKLRLGWRPTVESFSAWLESLEQ